MKAFPDIILYAVIVVVVECLHPCKVYLPFFVILAEFQLFASENNLHLDEGAELYKCDRLLDVVSLQDTLVASPVATSIQPPHVRFQVLLGRQRD